MSSPELIFLYQTRTILRNIIPFRRAAAATGYYSKFSPRTRARCLASTTKTTASSSSSSGADAAQPQPHQESEEEVPSSSFFRHKVGPAARPETPINSNRRSTITPAERRVFDRLFQALPTTTSLLHDPDAEWEKFEADTDPDNIVALFSSPTTIYRRKEVRESSRDRRGGTEEDDDDGEEGETTKKGDEEAQLHLSVLEEGTHAEIAEFSIPEENAQSLLLGSAAKAEDGGDIAAVPNDTADVDGEVDQIVREEMKSISAAFAGALASKKMSPDVALWDVCMKRVFPLTRLLAAKSSSLSTASAKSSPRDSAEVPVEEAAAASTEMLSLPSHVLPLRVVSRLYPASLLLALRLYAKHLPASPYGLAVLPYLRSLGPTSNVLGGSAQIYNTLLKLKWDVYSDLRGISDLLTEMERGGIEADAHTYRLLVRIGEERWVDFHHPDGEEMRKGARGRGWWERREQLKWFPKVGVEWKRVIAGRLREQGLGALVSEREYGEVSRPADSLGHTRPVLIG